jgi:DnaK suppressor protein
MKKKELNNLLVKYTELRNNLINVIERSDCEVDVAGDSVDKLQGASLLRVQNQVIRNNLIKLRSFNRAIELINNGEYGYCEECEESIGIRRLEAIPGCVLCISCAEKSELYR